MSAPVDAFGRYVPGTAVKGRPPFRSTPVWDGLHGDWRLSAVRIAGDDLVHVTGLHLGTGATHSERLAVATPGDVKRWADTLPSQVGGEVGR